MAKIPTAPRASNKTTYDTLPKDLYPARMVRFVGLGTQPQPEYKGQAKDPAPKVAVMFELFDPETGDVLDVRGVDSEGNEVFKPSCVFTDMFLFPGAERGKVFDMSKALDSSVTKVADDFDWFIDRLGAPVMVEIDHYPKKDGTVGTKISSIVPVSKMVAKSMPEARSELVGFDPYDGDVEKYKIPYAKLFGFQRDILKEALDSKHIPLAGTEPVKLGDDEAPKGGSSNPIPQPQKATSQGMPSMDFDDDIPFAPIGMQEGRNYLHCI